MDSLFQLPDELLFATLSDQFPCREPQIRALATLLHPAAAPCRNIVLHGTRATAKSAVTEALLEKLADIPDGAAASQTQIQYSVVNSVECVTARHLFERTVASVAHALSWDNVPSRCENVAQLTVELSKMLKYVERPAGYRFVLVFDAIDRQREAPPTLLPALARLSEIMPVLTTVFVVTSPPPNVLRTSGVPHIHFPNYTKTEFVQILAASPPPGLPTTTETETADLWARFVAAVHDSLTRTASRTLPSLQQAALALWPRFTAPVLAGTHAPREFSKLLVAARAYLQDEGALNPGLVVAARPKPGTTTTTTNTITTTTTTPLTPARPSQQQQPQQADLAALLPSTARALLLAAYLASHNAARHDLTLFSTTHHGRRRRRGGGGGRTTGPGRRSKHRKIARKLLGAHAFVLERMLAIFAAVRAEWGSESNSGGPGPGGGKAAVDGDVGMALATLASLRLLVRVGAGGGDALDRGAKWRVNVSWEVVRGLGRSMGVEVEEWLIE